MTVIQINCFLQVTTTEEHCPSMKIRDLQKGHGCPFSPTAQTAKNVGTVVQCEECGKWRCLHAAKKLHKKMRDELEVEMETILYSCGSVFENVDAGGDDSVLTNIYVRANIHCGSQIEKSYYSAGYEDICIHCGTVENLVVMDGLYPYCQDCAREDRVNRRCKKFTAKD